MKPTQTDLTFYLNVYQDVDLLPKCLNQLRKIYPQSRLIIRSDGNPDPTIAHIAEIYHSHYYYGERLFTSDKGGQIIHEMLRFFLMDETRYLFKIDPDTVVARPFKGLPTMPCVFGTLQQTGDAFSIQGGCLGITLEVAKRFYESAILLEPALAGPSPCWAVTPLLQERARIQGLTSFDWIIGWACKKMEIELVDWPEIMSEWQVTPPNDNLYYAVTHPHKMALNMLDAKRSALRYWQNVISVTGHSIVDD